MATSYPACYPAAQINPYITCELPSPLLRPPSALAIQQRSLAIYPPTITTKATVTPQHPVARHQYRNTVLATGGRRCTHGTWLVDSLRDFAIADNITFRKDRKSTRLNSSHVK